MTTLILRLPEDVFIEIFEISDYRAILACQATCRSLSKIVTGSVSLQYKIELAACGMLDGPRNEHTAGMAERLRRLRLYDAAWRQLKWTAKTSFPHLADRFWPAIEAGGALVAHMPSNSAVDAPGPILQQIPSQLRGVEEHHMNAPMSVTSENLIDSSQDVFTSVGRASAESPSLFWHCRLRSWSTGQVHPLSRDVDPCAHMRLIVLIDMYGDFILEAGTHDQKVWDYVVWNWKTGSVETVQTRHTYCTCHFLDERRILMTNDSGFGALPPLRVITFRSTGSTSNDSTGGVELPSYSFQLPECINVEHMRSTISTTRQPALSRLGHFYRDPNDRLITISVSAPEVVSRSGQLCIDIPVQTFQSYIATHPPSDGHTDIVVPWNAWGPSSSRVSRAPALSDFSWIRGTFTAGLRKIIMRRSTDGSTTTMTVLDYHPRRVARALSRQRHGEDDGITILRGDDITAVGFEDLQTTLPCIAKTIPLPEELEAMLLSEGAILGVHLCDDGVLFVKHIGYGAWVTDLWAYTI
ncbi:hypothetical protein BV25DRAFT_1914965 [Artomyces pyxidatus]|uniref:Uncharacterized protein n=1 Tax=Artomyces pyxidatus TaxID=48021 RepID=A0ACB8T663_9AGAM|nr:hypothetical protein BV25DRAFT_1914965 [Artomyces pyxidatus]